MVGRKEGRKEGQDVEKKHEIQYVKNIIMHVNVQKPHVFFSVKAVSRLCFFFSLPHLSPSLRC